jgi:hypothetical protein
VTNQCPLALPALPAVFRKFHRPLAIPAIPVVFRKFHRPLAIPALPAGIRINQRALAIPALPAVFRKFHRPLAIPALPAGIRINQRALAIPAIPLLVRTSVTLLLRVLTRARPSTVPAVPVIRPRRITTIFILSSVSTCPTTSSWSSFLRTPLAILCAITHTLHRRISAVR